MCVGCSLPISARTHPFACSLFGGMLLFSFSKSAPVSVFEEALCECLHKLS